MTAESSASAARRRQGYGLILLAAVIYSTTEVALKSQADAFGVMQITVWRVLIGALVLLPAAVKQLHRSGIRLGWADAGRFAVLGFICVALHLTSLQLALQEMDASATAAIYSGNPIFAAVFAHFILSEPLHRRNLAALGLEVLGIVCILDPFGLQLDLTGLACVLTATISFALYGTFSKLFLPRYGSIPLSCFVLLCGGLELLAVCLLGELPAAGAVFRSLGLGIFSGVSFFTGFTPESAAVLAYLCVVVTGGGYWLLTAAVERTSATEASFIYLFKPILATVFSAVLLGESVSLHHLAGLAFFTAASLTVLLPVLRGTSQPAKTA